MYLCISCIVKTSEASIPIFFKGVLFSVGDILLPFAVHNLVPGNFLYKVCDEVYTYSYYRTASCDVKGS
jgi:hypothetical protein